MEKLIYTDGAMIEVTPWSKTPTRQYEPVNFEMIAMVDIQETLILFTRASGHSMAIHLTADGVRELAKELTEIQRRFRLEKNKGTNGQNNAH